MIENESSRNPFGALDLGALSKIRMGPGIVGRTSFVVVGFLAFAILAIWAVHDQSTMVAWFFGVTAFVIASYLFFAFWYGNKFPHFAVMDGAEMVRYTELQQAAKEPKTIDVTVEPTANTPPPTLASPSGGE